MTIYAGETIRISTDAIDYDDSTVITNVDVTSVTVTVHDSTDVEILPATAMSWDAANNEWYLDWDTTGVDAGTYTAKCIITGLSFSSWEFKRFRLNVNRF